MREHAGERIDFPVLDTAAIHDVVARTLSPAHLIAVAAPGYLIGRMPPVDLDGLTAFVGIVMRSWREMH
ncbi:hypothetical protein ASG43_18915 [Aureimonas sp. Leaf454]|nr:hypothetical protein ASG43_18915 [Aureimonas sp. Leaf454]